MVCVQIEDTMLHNAIIYFQETWKSWWLIVIFYSIAYFLLADANTKKKRKPRGKQFEPVTRMVDGNWRIPGPGVAQPLYGLEGHLENDLNYKEDPMNGVIQHLKDVNGRI